MKYKLLTAILLMALPVLASDLDYAFRLPAELQVTEAEALIDLTWQQGTTPLIQVEVLRRGRPVDADTNTTVRMIIGPSSTGTYYAVAYQSTTTNTSYYIQWPTVGTNSHGTNATAQAWWYTIYFARNGHDYWTGNGDLYIEKTTSTGTNGLTWQTITAGLIEWGNVIGTLADQADLVAALDAKISGATITTGAAPVVVTNAGILGITVPISVGPQGEQGIQGIQGATGPTGATGTQGIQGLTGSIGPTGETGAQGIQGLTGSNGLDGATGPQGTQGIQGVQGEIGPAGTNGVDGVDGTNGLDGAVGPPGTNGINGVDGIQGPAGTNGVDGATGPQGPAGTNGTDGAQGPAGTNGLDGADGIDGIQGPPGTNGLDGVDGTNGLDGAEGPQGTQGIQGVQGEIGPAGTNGLDGVDGTNGLDGATGPAGTNGIDGIDGAAGPQGPAGTNGIDGIDGAQGPPGTNGLDGIDGTNGVDGADGLVGAVTFDQSTSNNAYLYGAGNTNLQITFDANNVKPDDPRLTDSRDPNTHDQDWSTITNHPLVDQAIIDATAATNFIGTNTLQVQITAVETGKVDLTDATYTDTVAKASAAYPASNPSNFYLSSNPSNWGIGTITGGTVTAGAADTFVVTGPNAAVTWNTNAGAGSGSGFPLDADGDLAGYSLTNGSFVGNGTGLTNVPGTETSTFALLAGYGITIDTVTTTVTHRISDVFSNRVAGLEAASNLYIAGDAAVGLGATNLALAIGLGATNYADSVGTVVSNTFTNTAALAAAALPKAGGTLTGETIHGTNAISMGTNAVKMYSGYLSGTNGVYWLAPNGTNYWLLFQ